ncbi:PmoA family protein [Microbacterium sp. Sa4CUA7]|uniref:PmoA family protein n=1 Tax=Microbacterium pullorum TaxID=2762236 RepID=A0ABR8S2H2_9MICO|nr:PmoA family protein [Microbacterium pullorum]MBD7957671.1 PmoA family protein [Microbacterium pullorum]
MTFEIDHDDAAAFTVRDGDIELLRYTYAPDSPQLESPKPYLHPLRTRAGHLVSLFRPWDHVWHKGIAWSLPVVGEENFWGGPTFVRDRGYVQLPNDGTQAHRGIDRLGVDDDGVVRFAHELDWVSEGGIHLFTERRELTARVLHATAWVLTVDTAMTNVSGEQIALGSPTTRGRDNAGYGGLFWRGPRSFTGGTLVTADGTGSGDDVRGQRHEWMAFAGRHDEVDAQSLVVMVDAVDNPHHPPQWFARSEEFACLNPAPFFSDELVVQPDETVAFRYGVGIADGGAEAARGVADAVRAVIGGA